MCGRGPHDLRRGLDAVQPGHLQVHQDHVGLQVQGQVDCRPAVRGGPDHLHGVRRREHGFEALPELVVVVDHQDPQCVHAHPALSCVDPVGGSAPVLTVPRPDADVSVQVPPSSSARSRIDDRPTPITGDVARPTPVSRTSMQQRVGVAAQ